MTSLDSNDILLIVDMQNDFLPGGSLAIAGADTLIPVINAGILLFLRGDLSIYASRDWHPTGHCSFERNGGKWPVHCVVDSYGALFHADLSLPKNVKTVSKGITADKEEYSALCADGFLEELQKEVVQRIFVCGVAMEYCVFESARDLLLHGFTVVIVKDAVKSIDPQKGEAARTKLQTLGAVEMTLSEISV